MRGKPITDKEWETIVSTLAPYLQRGLSVKKACFEAKIPFATVYRKMREDEEILHRIEALQNFKLVAYSDFILRKFLSIYEKANKKEPITKDEMKFIYWMGENDKTLAEMFGKTTVLTGKDGLPVIPVVLQQPKNLKALLEMLEIIKKRGGLEEDGEQTKNSDK